MFQQYLNTPIGGLCVVANENGVTAIRFDANDAEADAPNAITQLCCEQLNEYFSGKRTHFSVPLDAKGTAFQHSVWKALVAINFGDTCAYSDIANSLNNPKACRAVGAANGKNPIPIIVPCHRVIGRAGGLTGFAGGLNRKAWLLRHEGHNI